MKRALIIHGWGANPGMHWFLPEKAYLESLGYQVEAPLMPNRFDPTENLWLKVINDFAPDTNTILVGHSLGGTTILEYLETTGQKVDKVLLVAAPIRFNEKLELCCPHTFKLYAESVGTECFLDLCEYEEIYNWKKIRQSANEFALIYKKDDLRVPPEEGNFLAKKLNARLQILDGFDHGNYIDLEVLNAGILQ